MKSKKQNITKNPSTIGAFKHLVAPQKNGHVSREGLEKEVAFQLQFRGAELTQAHLRNGKVTASRYNFSSKSKQRCKVLFVIANFLDHLEYKLQEEGLKQIKPDKSICSQTLGPKFQAKGSCKNRKTAMLVCVFVSMMEFQISGNTAKANHL